MKCKKGKCKDCDYYGPLIAGRCRIHYWRHRASLKPRKQLKSLSKGRTLQEGEYRRKRDIFLIENPICEVRSCGCTVIATEVHHMKGRVGKLLTDERYFLAVCRNCHNYIEMNPLWAKEKGYSVSRLKKD